MLDLLDVRTETMRRALELFTDRSGQVIVETGCTHREDDWTGAGMSTVVFGEYLSRHGGHLWTVDNDQTHLATARDLTESYRAVITYELGDSVEFLRDFVSPIDLLYLDSLDYPYGALLDLYGGREDIEAAKAKLAALPETQIVYRHRRIILASQEHAREEVLAAAHALEQDALVLIDDAGLPGGGKARLARPILQGLGFREIASGYQTLWSRS